MDLNDLLHDIEGIGGDAFVPSTPAPQPPAPPPGELPAEPAPAACAAPAGIELLDLPAGCGSLDMIVDVELDVLVELGQVRVPLKQMMAIQPGDHLILDGRADAPLKVFVNNRLVAYGEALIIDGSLAIRLLELLVSEESR